MDRTMFQMKLATTAQQIALVERDLETIREPADALAGARESARKAARGLVELDELFNATIEPSPAMRACLACGKSVTVKATRCGYCWTKIVLAASG